MSRRSPFRLPWLSWIAVAAVPLTAQMAAPLQSARSNLVALGRSDDLVYVFRGTSAGRADSLEVYHPWFGPVGYGPEDPYGGPVALISGDRILESNASGAVYTPASSAWTGLSLTSPMDQNQTLVPLTDGSILLAGGIAAVRGAFVYLSSCYLIDPITLRSTQVGSLNTGRSSPMVLLRNGQVLAAGGHSYDSDFQTILVTAETYDPLKREWQRTGALQRLAGDLTLIALSDGSALATGLSNPFRESPSVPVAERYDPGMRQWSVIPGLSPPATAAVVALPNGKVLFSGGKSSSIIADNTIYDPADASVRQGTPLLLARSSHAPVVLHDGTVLLLGGETPVGVTNTVERYPWEPRILRSLDPGFYVATAEQSAAGTDGIWSLEARTSDAVVGGFSFGGVALAGGKDVAFASFTIAQAQTITGNVALGAYTSGPGSLSFSLQILDSDRKPVGTPFSGTGTLQWSKDLPAGYYIVEIRSGPSTPDAPFHAEIFGSRFEGGVSSGASLLKALGAPGYLGFSVATTQDTMVNLYNSNTIGYPRGASEVVLALFDSKGKAIKRTGPGAESLP